MPGQATRAMQHREGVMNHIKVLATSDIAIGMAGHCRIPNVQHCQCRSFRLWHYQMWTLSDIAKFRTLDIANV